MVVSIWSICLPLVFWVQILKQNYERTYCALLRAPGAFLTRCLHFLTLQMARTRPFM